MRIRALLLTIFCSAALASRVSAQFRLDEPPATPSEAEVERARESFGNGLTHADAGRWPQAALAFEEAYRRSGNPVALLNLASALRESGRLVDARVCIVQMRVRHAEHLDAETRRSADEIYASVTATVQLKDAPPTALVTLDGEEQAPRQTRFELDPGPHHIQVSNVGRLPFVWKKFLSAGEAAEVSYRAKVSAEASELQRGARPSARDHADLQARPAKRRMARWAVGLLIGTAVLAVGAAVAIPLVLREEGLSAPRGVDAIHELP